GDALPYIRRFPWTGLAPCPTIEVYGVFPLLLRGTHRMTPEILSCPYCNSSVALSSLPKAGQRIRCPRCQELFPVRSGEPNSPETKLQGSPILSPNGRYFEETPATVPSSPPWSRRAVAATVLGVMGMMAAIGLTFAWYTTEMRRKNDYPDP